MNSIYNNTHSYSDGSISTSADLIKYSNYDEALNMFYKGFDRLLNTCADFAITPVDKMLYKGADTKEDRAEVSDQLEELKEFIMEKIMSDLGIE